VLTVLDSDLLKNGSSSMRVTMDQRIGKRILHFLALELL